MATKNPIKVNMNPVYEYEYVQIPNHGFLFSLLNKNNRVLYTPSPCKDYLQDIFWAEYTGNEAKIWGIRWEQGMLDMDVEYFKLLLIGDGIDMKSKVENMTIFLNKFDDAQGFKHTTILETDDPEKIIIVFSKEWTSNGPQLSAFTTMLRMCGIYNGNDDIINYLKNLAKMASGKLKVEYHPYMYVDIKRVPIERLAALLAGKKVEYDWNKFKCSQHSHDIGLVYFDKFPTVEVK